MLDLKSHESIGSLEAGSLKEIKTEQGNGCVTSPLVALTGPRLQRLLGVLGPVQR